MHQLYSDNDDDDDDDDDDDSNVRRGNNVWCSIVLRCFQMRRHLKTMEALLPFS